MKIVATIETRMTSSPLPGKVVLKTNGKPILKHLARWRGASVGVNAAEAFMLGRALSAL